MNGNKILNPYQYPYCEFDFMEWNPVQLKCYPFFEQDVNLIVSSSTASGKTSVAEAIMGYELNKDEESKVVYVSPFKSIGKEKFNNWSFHKTFKQYKKKLVSSEENVSESDLIESRIIVSTIESMNIRCRSKNSWIKKVKVFILDESHIINDEKRGADCESLIMSITLLNPECRIICLSGTMNNYVEIAKWIKKCNGKRTCYIHSDWRPKELIKEIKVIKNAEDEFEKILQESKISCEDELKTLIFVHSKKKGEKLMEYLRKNDIKCAFYNSDLRSSLKNKIIFDFKNKYSSLYILICTSSLSTGVSL